jgi:hypothetical protein
MRVGGPPNWGLGVGLTTPDHEEISMLRTSHTSLGLGWIIQINVFFLYDSKRHAIRNVGYTTGTVFFGDFQMYMENVLLLYGLFNNVSITNLYRAISG